LSDELNEILGMIFEVDPRRRIRLDELRNRIINCHQFTKRSSETPALPVETVVQDYEIFNEPLSLTSTISEEGSMISDHSDNSTVPSEVDVTSEFDLSFEVMDEDCDPSYQGLVPVAPAPVKAWNAGSTFAPNCNPYVSDSAREATDSDIAIKSEVTHQVILQNPAEFHGPPVQVPASAISPGNVGSTTLSQQNRGRQFLAHRGVTSSQLSLLSTVPVWRAF